MAGFKHNTDELISKAEGLREKYPPEATVYAVLGQCADHMRELKAKLPKPSAKKVKA